MYSALAGNRVLLLKPNLHEMLDEMAIAEITLPEEIERMRAAKKTDQEMVST